MYLYKGIFFLIYMIKLEAIVFDVIPTYKLLAMSKEEYQKYHVDNPIYN